MDISIKINKDEHNELFNYKKTARNKLVQKIFDFGYKIKFQTLNLDESDIETSFTSKEQFDLIKQSTEAIQKFTNLTANSSKKGELSELFLEDIFKSRYGDIIYEDKSKEPHSGDAWVHLPDSNIIMIESKNYSNTVNIDEVNKMKRDMIEKNINYGIFVSFSSNVCKYKEVDIINFNHSSKDFIIMVISNFKNDISRLDISYSLLRTLIKNKNPLKFPWIVSNINKELLEFNTIIEQQQKLRDKFITTQSKMNELLNDFYKEIVDYQELINKKAKSIIKNIQDTMEQSLPLTFFPNESVLELANTKKMKTEMMKVLDLFDSINLKLTKNLDIYCNDKNLGKLKIVTKKINIHFPNIGVFVDINKDNVDRALKFIKSIISVV